MKHIFILEPGDKFSLDNQPYKIVREQKITAGEQNDNVILYGPNGNTVEVPAHTVIFVLLSPSITKDDNFRTLYPGEFGHQDGEPIRAEVRDDGNRLEMDFDAKLFFMEATDAEIKEVHEGGYSGAESYEATERIADHFREVYSNSRVSECLGRPENSFYVNVNKDDVAKWLRAHRPALAQELFGPEGA